MSARYVCGFHAVEAILAHAPQRLLQIFLATARQDGRRSRLRQRAQALGIACIEVTAGSLDRLSGGVAHQGVVAQVRGAATLDEQALVALLRAAPGPNLVLVLDGLQDPHNLGACLRTAEGARADAVVIPKHGAAGITPAVTKVASGAAELVPVARLSNLARGLQRLRELGLWVIGTAQDGADSCHQCDLTVPVAIVLGAEDRGMRRLTRECCDQVVQIPMQGALASLNVSVAAGILLYEAVRQRRLGRR